MKHDIDVLVMLLSSDWFFDSWSSLGINIEVCQKLELQKRCREILNQIMDAAVKHGTEQYFYTSFEEQRVKETQNLFLEAIEKIENNEALIAIYDTAVFERPSNSNCDETILCSITRQILAGGLQVHCVSLGTSVVNLMKEIAASVLVVNPMEFEVINLNSNTVWDTHLRDLIPEDQTLLSDYLWEVLTKSSFEQFWRQLKEKLSEHDLSEVKSWYSEQVMLLTGQQANFPGL